MILLAAIADFIIGTFVGPKSDSDMAKGFIGYNCEYPNHYIIKLYLLQ